jgi:hypothetical protein
MEKLTIDAIIEHCDRKTRMYEKACDIKYLETTMNNSTKEYWEHKQVAEYLRKFKDYEDLEEQGRLVKLPCKAGDTVYGINTDRNIVSALKIISVKIYSYAIYFDYQLIDGIYKNIVSFADADIGKTVFLTKSEAEAKLKELRCDND